MQNGADIIAYFGQLSDANVTSPTGLRQLAQLSGARPDLDVVRWLEQAAS
jgi:hypothetical protein